MVCEGVVGSLGVMEQTFVNLWVRGLVEHLVMSWVGTWGVVVLWGLDTCFDDGFRFTRRWLGSLGFRIVLKSPVCSLALFCYWPGNAYKVFVEGEVVTDGILKSKFQNLTFHPAPAF